MNTRLKRENRGVLIIFILIIILFFSNIFGASGQPYTSYIKDGVLNIPQNVQIVIPDTVVLKLTNIIMEEGSSLVNNGTIKIVESCESDTYADFNFDVSCYQYLDNSHPKNVFTNNGSFYCKNYNQKIITKSSNNGHPIEWTNNGEIICSGDFNMEIPQTHVYKSDCDSKLKADAINLILKKGVTLNGNFNTNKMIIDSEDGGDKINFGGDCGTSNISISELTLKNNISEVNIKGITCLEKINANTHSTVKLDVDGNLIIGEIDGQHISITGTSNSLITICYNPKHGLTDGHGDFSWNGINATTSGTLIYRYDENDTIHSWYTDGTPNNPKSENERDIVCDGCTMIENVVTLSECVNGVARFLPIELVSFEYKDGKFIWTTASETNNDYFVVEYSGNGYDWVECTEHIGSLSNTGYTYSTVPIIQINKSLFSYFRLKQVDLDGKYSYSRVIAISFFIESPCSDEYEGTKIQIRELGGKWFRRIDGGLIYCDKDNQESH